MSEAPRPNPPLSLEAVAQVASAVMMQDGYHRPTVIAEGDRERVVAQINPMAPTAEGRAQQLFALGAVLAEQGDLGVLYQVFFITEAWMSLARADEEPVVPPSEDPDRTEILLIARLIVHPPQQEVAVFEMQRDEQGQLRELQHFGHQEAADQLTAESPLLVAFALGYLGRSLDWNA